MTAAIYLLYRLDNTSKLARGVHFRDGRVMGKVVEIPHRHVAHIVRAEFP